MTRGWNRWVNRDLSTQRFNFHICATDVVNLICLTLGPPPGWHGGQEWNVRVCFCDLSRIDECPVLLTIKRALFYSYWGNWPFWHEIAPDILHFHQMNDYLPNFNYVGPFIFYCVRSQKFLKKWKKEVYLLRLPLGEK